MKNVILKMFYLTNTINFVPNIVNKSLQLSLQLLSKEKKHPKTSVEHPIQNSYHKIDWINCPEMPKHLPNKLW